MEEPLGRRHQTGAALTSDSRVLTVPNALSVLRLILVPVFLYLLLLVDARGWAVGVLMFSGFSDWADGKIARLVDNQSSRLGELLDPAVDRIYMVTVPLALAIYGAVPWWIVLTLIGRDVVLAATLPVLKTAQGTIPDRDEIKNTGQLMRAIRRRRASKTRKGSEAVQVYIRKGKKRGDESGAYYAPMVEFGAKGLAPTRWFTRSLETNAKTSTEIFRKNLAGSIARIAKKIGNENLRMVAAQVKKL